MRFGHFQLPPGDTLVVQGTSQLRMLDLDMIDWSYGGRLELRGVVISDQGERNSSFPVTLDESQELVLVDSRLDSGNSMFIVEGARIESQGTTLSSQGTVFDVTHSASRLSLSATRFGASNTALRAMTGDLELDACVFLTNTQALVTGEMASLDVSDCLFQANEVAIDISGEQVPILLNVDIVDSRDWDVINRSTTQAVDLGDVYLGGGNTSKVQGEFIGVNMPLAPRHPVYEAASPLLVPGTIVVGEVPLTFVPQGITTVDAIPCRESRYKIFLSEQPYVFPAEPFLVTTTPEYPLSLQVSGMRFVRITAELGRWQ
jgi:hypothetical protein